MPDEPTPTPQPKPGRNPRSRINQRHLSELQKTEEIKDVAKKAQYAPQLAGRKITAAFITELENLLIQAENIITAATGKTIDKEVITAEERQLRDDLIELLRSVQKAAKQHATDTGDNSWLAKYFVGDKFYSNRALLEQTAATFLANAPGDDLPGITQGVLQEITDKLAEYKTKQGSQSTAQSTASAKRIDLASIVKNVAKRRRQIQLAADALWSHRHSGNLPIRREFKIPVTKSLN